MNCKVKKITKAASRRDKNYILTKCNIIRKILFNFFVLLDLLYRHKEYSFIDTKNILYQEYMNIPKKNEKGNKKFLKEIIINDFNENIVNIDE